MSETEQKTFSLYFKSIPSDYTEAKLKEAVSKHAEVKSVRIPLPHRSDRRRYGFVEFQNEEDMNKVLEAMNNTELEGNTITVEIAKSRPHPSTKEDKPRRERGERRERRERRRRSPVRRHRYYSDDYDYYDDPRDRRDRRRRSPIRRRYRSYDDYSDYYDYYDGPRDRRDRRRRRRSQASD